MPVEIVDYVPGMLIGKGYDSVSQDVKISPAVRGKVGTQKGLGGQQGEYQLTIVETSEDFDLSLGISAGFSAGIPGFGGSAKMDFKKKCKVSKQATFCVLSYNVVNAFETYVDDVRLSESAFNLLQVRNEERFRERFGNCFVSGMYSGGDFFGSIRIEAETTEEQLSIAAKIKAGWGLYGGSASTDVELKNIVKQENIEIMTYQTGGEVVPEQTIDGLFSRAVAVAKEISKDKAFPISVTLEDYNELELPHDDVSFVEQQHAKKAMKHLRVKYRDLLELQEDIDFILRNPNYYEGITQEKHNELNKAAIDITKELNTIAEKADTCARDFSQCELYQPTYPDVELPKRKKKSSKNSAPARTSKATRTSKASNAQIFKALQKKNQKRNNKAKKINPSKSNGSTIGNKKSAVEITEALEKSKTASLSSNSTKQKASKPSKPAKSKKGATKKPSH